MKTIANLVKYVEHGTLPIGNEIEVVREHLEPHGYGDFVEKFVELYLGLEMPSIEEEEALLDYLSGGASIIMDALKNDYPQFSVNSVKGSFKLKVYVLDTNNPFDRNSTYTELADTWSWHSQERATLIAFLKIIEKRGR